MQLRARAAFSLMEVLVVMAILGMFLGLSLSLSSSRQKNQLSAQSLAVELSSQLRWARERSRARGVPVALVFPRQPQPACQSALVLEGQVHGRVLRRLDYRNYAALIHLGSDSSTTVPARFSPTHWLPDSLKDQSVVAFLPNGQHWFQHLHHQAVVTAWAVGQNLGGAFVTGLAPFQSNSSNFVGARSFAPLQNSVPAQAQATGPNARDFFAEMLQVFSALQRQFASMAGDQQNGNSSDPRAAAQRAAGNNEGSGFPGGSNSFSAAGNQQTSDQQADAQRAATNGGSGFPSDSNQFQAGGSQPTSDQQAAAQQQAADNQSSGFPAAD